MVLTVAVPTAIVWIIKCKIAFACTQHSLGAGSVLYKCWLFILVLRYAKSSDSDMPMKEGRPREPRRMAGHHHAAPTYPGFHLFLTTCFGGTF